MPRPPGPDRPLHPRLRKRRATRRALVTLDAGMRAVTAEDVMETRGLVPTTMLDLDGCNMRVSRQLEVPNGTDARKQTNKYTHAPIRKQTNENQTNTPVRSWKHATCTRDGRACYLHHLIHSFARVVSTGAPPSSRPHEIGPSGVVRRAATCRTAPQLIATGCTLLERIATCCARLQRGALCRRPSARPLRCARMQPTAPIA